MKLINLFYLQCLFSVNLGPINIKKIVSLAEINLLCFPKLKVSIFILSDFVNYSNYEVLRYSNLK